MDQFDLLEPDWNNNTVRVPGTYAVKEKRRRHQMPSAWGYVLASYR